MNIRVLEEQLSEAQEKMLAMQEELAQTNRGLVALTMELEQRVDERTSELRAAHAELKKTNSDLMQLTLELEDRVASRVRELGAANETLRKSRFAALNLMEDAVALRTEAERVNVVLQAEIEQRTRAEDEIRKFNVELEQRVADRTAQLESANKELEAFSYSVSHDLRAPLRAVDGFSRIVLEEYAQKLDPEAGRLLKIIISSTKKMDELITDLLDLSRVGRNEMNISRVAMAMLASSIYHETETDEMREKFSFSVAPIPDAYCDPVLIRQVWRNLISNAIKFTTPRDVRRIEIGSQVEGENTVYFIRDSGVGFDPRYAHKLFGVFQRLHTTEEFEGTGVGLAIVQRIVHRHGGKVWAEGKVGEGATFWFSLPNRQEARGNSQ